MRTLTFGIAVALVLELVLVVAGGCALAPPARAEDTPADPAGRNLAATCANCHGTQGRARGGMAVLAGMPAAQLLASVSDYRSGAKPATIMGQIAKGYTDAQLRSVAAYYATLPKPP